MNILLDTCVWGGVTTALQNAGHNAIWAGDWEQDPGDTAILAQAYQEKRVLVTLDNDFGELAVLRGLPHSGIVRLVNLSSKQQVQVCLRVLERYQAELERGAIVTAELGRVRIRVSDEKN